MKITILKDSSAVSHQAARYVAEQAREAVAVRGQFLLAVSGGSTPWQMLRELAQLDIPWHGVHLFQVDERVAPVGDPDRNLTHLKESLLQHAPIDPQQIHAMPVEEANLESAAQQYAQTLKLFAGDSPILDLVHLGLGPDGHTASLVPDDPVLEVMDRDTAITGMYNGRQRMTLTYPMLNRARAILWLITGESKAEMLIRLRARDVTIPAGRVRQERATVIADEAAEGG